MKKGDRRKHVSSRKLARNGFTRATILRGKKQYRTQVLDYDSGGVGISLSDEIVTQLQPAVGEILIMQFFLGGVQHNDIFFVQSVGEDRIGLQYTNKKYMNSQNRLKAV